MGMLGGGEGSFIGPVHRMAAHLDGKIRFVCGAFSRDRSNTLATGSTLGITEDRLYDSYDEMFAAERVKPADERMEAVCIVTPNHLHVPAAKAAIEAGFHVICDKPAGVSYREVSNLATTMTPDGPLYALTHTYLGYPMVWQARHLVAQKSFGEIRRVIVEYPQGWLAAPIDAEGQKQAEWRNDPKRSGPAGCMGDIGSHAHSLVEFVTNTQMTEVAAKLRSHFAHRTLDDDGEVSFRLSNGATGVLTASQVCFGEENALTIRVYGETGSIMWQQMEPNTLKEHISDGTIRLHRAGTDKPLCDEALARCRLPAGHPEGYIEAFANLYSGFATAIAKGESHTAPGVPGILEALSGMAFVEAVVASSAAAGQWTSTALQTQNIKVEE